MSRNEVDHILFGAAYYDEYLMMKGIDRIDEDMKMMKDAGLNVIRIAESTWSTCEPQPDVFDFTYVDRALDAAQRAGIDVIVGTPTYAVPSWLVKLDPSVLAVTPNGQGKYGARQIMDIVNATYRFYGERVIRKLISHVADHPAVIGYQVDNETKYYDSVSEDMQRLFVKYLREKFHGDLDELNHHFGLDYWSNRIDSWEDFPDVTATINESLGGEFDKFRRDQVRAFLQWQADIVREYAHDDQFITHNFDFEWRGYSYGVQPAVDHFKASTAVDITGVDIYHPTEDDLTGKEIAFGGDMTRSTKDGRNYLVLETEAQGQHGWVPFPGQLRLQAYSHLASGADMVEYWHWHSIHNSFETYWKGLLGHDLEPNPTYREAGVFGREIAKPEVGERLVHLKKHNKVAIMVSNESLTALDWFLIEAGFPFGGTLKYNDVVRNIYDALFELNVECDFIPVRRAGRTPGQIRDDRDPGAVLYQPGSHRSPARIRLQRRSPRLHHALLRNRRRGDRMARPRAAQPHRRVRHDLQPVHPSKRPRVRGIRRNARQNPGKRRAGAHRTGHPIRRHRRARRLRPLRMEGLRRGDPTRLRQGRRRMDRHPARRRYHPSCSTRSRGACGHRRCRHRARRTGDGASRNERSRRAGDVSAQLFRRRSHHRQPGVGRCGGRPGGSGFRRHR